MEMQRERDLRFDGPVPSWAMRSAIQRARELAAARRLAHGLGTAHQDDNEQTKANKRTFLCAYLEALKGMI